MIGKEMIGKATIKVMQHLMCYTLLLLGKQKHVFWTIHKLQLNFNLTLFLVNQI